MRPAIDRIDNLDVSLFDAILSQTSVSDRRALLAVQRATARKHGEYFYLEIGSYLGGSIQPFLLDTRCATIYSIDSRRYQFQDDRGDGSYTPTLKDNSREKMLALLRNLDADAVSKVVCFDVGASEVDPSGLQSPQIAFIDGEHTRQTVWSDFAFCYKVLARDGTILFHDFQILHHAIFEICRFLRRERRDFEPVLLGSNIFAIFFDQDKVYSDPYLAKMYAWSTRWMSIICLKSRLERMLPYGVLRPLKRVYRAVRRLGFQSCRNR